MAAYLALATALSGLGTALTNAWLNHVHKVKASKQFEDIRDKIEEVKNGGSTPK